MTYREIARKLASPGRREIPRVGGGSHRKGLNPATNRATVIPDGRGDDLKLGTTRAAVRRLGLSWDEFLKA